MEVIDLVEFIRKLKIPYSTEKEMQESLFSCFSSAGFNVQREFSLSPKDRIDFLITLESGAVGVECKTKGTPISIYRQLERYSKYDCISSLVLITSKHMNAGDEIKGKPTYTVKTGTKWL